MMFSTIVIETFFIGYYAHMNEAAKKNQRSRFKVLLFIGRFKLRK